jgi:hypothetical protein
MDRASLELLGWLALGREAMAAKSEDFFGWRRLAVHGVYCEYEALII